MNGGGLDVQLAQGPAILIEDQIKDSKPTLQSPFLLSETSERWSRIWFSEPVLEAVRKRDATTPVFGIWQTLINGGVIDLRRGELYGYERAGSGWSYLLVSDGVAIQSGNAFGDAIASLPGRTRSQAQFIDLNDPSVWAGCPYPLSRAVLPIELQRQMHNDKRRKVVIGFGSCLAIVIAALGIDMMDAAAHQSALDEMARLNQQLGSLRARYADEESRRLPLTAADLTNQALFLNRLPEALFYSVNPRTTTLVPVYGEREVSYAVDRVIPGMSFPWSLAINDKAELRVAISITPGLVPDPNPQSEVLRRQQMEGTRVE